MKKNHAFALLEILLTIILIVIVTAGSYALVKNSSADAAMEKLTRYSTSIADNYQPFLEGSVVADLIWNYKLSKDFLMSIYIPEDDLTDCSGPGGSTGEQYCRVKTGLYTPVGSPIAMIFREVPDSASTHFFVIEFTALTTPEQKDDIIQSLGSKFSIYCPDERCEFGHVKGTNNDTQLSIVFPKAGDKRP